MSLEVLLANLDAAYDRRSWHGPNLRSSFRGVSPAAAAWRSGPGRRSVREVAVHAAYWKYVVRRRLLGEKRGSFPLKGSNWFDRPDAPDAAGFREDVELLDATHRSLREAVAGLSPTDLAGSRGDVTVVQLVLGVGAHDVYHAGQVQLIRRMAAAAGLE